MAITTTDHIVLLVRSIEQGITTWQDKLGLHLDYRVDIDDASISQAFFTLPDGTFVELIAPLNDQSELANLLQSRQEGLHVLAMRVDNLEQTVTELQANNVRLVGAGTPRVFIHPSCANGLLIQLWPQDRPHRWRDALNTAN